MYPTRVVSRSPGAAADEADAGLRAEERRAVERVLAGETQAYRLLVDRYQRSVYAVIQRMVHHPADADDLAQQAFVAAYDALSTFDPELRFSSWVYRIAINLAKDHLKSKKRSEVTLDEGSDHEAVFAGQVPATDQPATAHERTALLERALALLPVADREVLILKDIEELPYEEMKRILGKPITALKIRVVRARERLRTVLTKMTGEGAL
jgi:RNA polymerase sigma-70 factor (ECF subfamily)